MSWCRFGWATCVLLGATTSAQSGSPVLQPYAQPSGLSQDITSWLAIAEGSQIAACKRGMLANINPPGAANGTVVASTSTQNPNYGYHWVRDAALTMDVVVELYKAASKAEAKSSYEQQIFQYAQARVTQQNDPNLQTGLGEPKFELNNTIFTGPWGRPQNDGPAEAASTLMDFIDVYLANGGDMEVVKSQIWNSTQAPVLRDLLFVVSNWSQPSFDLWEEVSGDQFFNRMVSQRALASGAKMAEIFNDSQSATTLSKAADAVAASLPSFWSEESKLIRYESGDVLSNKTSYKDIAVVLGVLHGYGGDNLFSPTNDQILATAYQIATSFISVYPIANVTTDASGGILGLPIGRYPEDVYTGTGTAPNGGNPWFLATAAMAELFYSAAFSLRQAANITVSDTSLPFWTYFAPSASLTAGQTYTSNTGEYAKAIAGLEGWADAFLRRVKFHAPAEKTFTEQYDRSSGNNTGAQNLTWSYAAVLTAAFARARLRNDTGYITAVADL